MWDLLHHILDKATYHPRSFPSRHMGCEGQSSHNFLYFSLNLMIYDIPVKWRWFFSSIGLDFFLRNKHVFGVNDNIWLMVHIPMSHFRMAQNKQFPPQNKLDSFRSKRDQPCPKQCLYLQRPTGFNFQLAWRVYTDNIFNTYMFFDYTCTFYTIYRYLDMWIYEVPI